IYFALTVSQNVTNFSNTCAAAAADEPDFALFLGDESGVYATSDKPGFMSQERAFERWEIWRVAASPFLARVPSLLVVGNHEGEAGFYRWHAEKDAAPAAYQRWGTIARKRYCPNPLPETAPEGGENESWVGDAKDEATGGADDGNRSPLQNYFAWTWGDALLAVLDVHRYTNPGGATPSRPEEWSLGAAQLKWLDGVL